MEKDPNTPPRYGLLAILIAAAALLAIISVIAVKLAG
jgi:hypothetical protein